MLKRFENVGLQTSEKVSWKKNKKKRAKHKIDRPFTERAILTNCKHYSIQSMLSEPPCTRTTFEAERQEVSSDLARDAATTP